jgi:hypothetical protein
MLLLLLVREKYHRMRLRVMGEEKRMSVEMMMLIELIFVVIEMSMVSHELLVVSHVWTGHHVMWTGRNVRTEIKQKE